MRLWIGLGILGAALIALIVAGDHSQVVGVDSDQFGRMAYLGALLVLMTAGVWHRFRDRMGENLRHLLIWVVIGAVVIAGYAYKEQAKEFGGTMLGSLRPGTAVVGAGGEVTITRRSDGDFSVFAEINGRMEQRFAFDTGASSVVLTMESAAALGIKPAEREFTQKVSTANGTALTAPIRLESITIGPITERNVDAMVSQPGALNSNLLGQSFLTRLPSYEVRGDRLILRSR
ncbi:TIGR02281 family clan AA aspartic protease [Methylobacterium sp. C25]|uniref:retropepsin-like aspartic protease family protein n=1 Tax=Methylobacterium sp. C25 TaxID=2721622 RepID=UPI001F343735|nr:TIGR02281 family clan AA aspartic protease [Methylobacterium sp. C25]MCE4222711.1 TIGR02281 family clan AA aspartic protease [Methylobacterium sp. C25]